MVKKSITLLTVLSWLVVTYMQVWAADPMNGWKCSKEIKLTGSGKYKAVMLDEDIYRNTLADLSDLRVVNSKGETVPYYLQSSTPYESRKSTTYKTQIVDRFTDHSDNYTDFRVLPLQENADILATSLSFSIAQSNFAKRIDLLGSYDGIQWQGIQSDNIYRVDSLSKTTVQLSSTLKYKYYRVKVPNNLESIIFDKLEVIYETVQKEYENYMRTAVISYELQHKDKTTILDIHNKDHLRISEIYLNTEGVFNRNYEVYTLRGTEESTYGVSGKLYNLDFKDVKLNETSIDFVKRPVSTEFIRIKINDKDDKPIDIKSMHASFLIHKLVFEARPGEEYRVFFGNSEAARPSYDINSFISHIEAEGQDICSLSNFQEYAGRAEVKKLIPLDTTLIFNGVIIIVAGLLIFIIARKLNSKS